MEFDFHNDDERVASDERDARNNDRAASVCALVPVQCVACGVLNPHDTDHCTNCGAATTLAAAYAHQQAHRVREHLNATLVNVLLQQGLLNDAVQAAHDADLGDTLRRIATNDFTEPPPTPGLCGAPVPRVSPPTTPKDEPETKNATTSIMPPASPS
jgi:hypothetical protein